MENKELNLKIELAKSWFVLAQITIILAGLFFATSGILLTNAQNTMNWGLDLAERAASKNCESLGNSSSYQNLINESFGYVGESVNTNLEIWRYSGYLGLFLVFLSLLFWWKGNHKINSLINS